MQTSQIPSVDGHPRPVILLVEDEASIREIAGEVLSSAGYRVLESSGPTEALRVAAQHRVDLLLTDIVMPEMNGPELARRLVERQPGLITMYMSGYAQRALDVTQNGSLHIQKPFSVRSLLEHVAQAISSGKRN